MLLREYIMLNDKITWDRFSYCAEGFRGRCDLHQNRHFGTGPVGKPNGHVIQRCSISRSKSEAEEPEKVLSVWTTRFFGR
jgi:hypothetical protein